MEITEKKIKIRDLVKAYEDNEDVDGSVTGYGGQLDIRPPYQRSFVYNAQQRTEVINTVMKGFPLNIMYWVKKKDGNYEILDGQQRTISICQFFNKDFSIIDSDGHAKTFNNLSPAKKDKFLDYELTVYICESEDPDEILAWFRIVNIAGEKLEEQELKNASYTGPWLEDAKRWFSEYSKSGSKRCPAIKRFGDYISTSIRPVRQDLLELALKWIAEAKGTTIDGYMNHHRDDPNANELKDYFQSVFKWVKEVFPDYTKYMKGLPWGEYYNEFHKYSYDPDEFGREVVRLIADPDVERNSGIYLYLLSEKTMKDEERERYLNIRTFDDNIKQAVYAKQNGICPVCQEMHYEQVHYPIEEMEADHIIPWSQGGRTILENCQMLCRKHNGYKSNK